MPSFRERVKEQTPNIYACSSGFVTLAVLHLYCAAFPDMFLDLITASLVFFSIHSAINYSYHMILMFTMAYGSLLNIVLVFERLIMTRGKLIDLDSAEYNFLGGIRLASCFLTMFGLGLFFYTSFSQAVTEYTSAFLLDADIDMYTRLSEDMSDSTRPTVPDFEAFQGEGRKL
eukprot:GHVL01010264.1.p1 GENE.GHVL01010264.1~~GHVL01010264.1.p1  ORF type:complete len:173 (-),score=8.73 GHVL01010264.1:264-782(-)